MTTGLLLRADDGFSVHPGTVWPITMGTTLRTRTRDTEHHHALGNWPNGAFITFFKTAKDILLPTKAYKRSHDLAIDSRVSKETPMTPNRVVPPCLQSRRYPMQQYFIPNRKGALTYAHISLTLLVCSLQAITRPRWRRSSKRAGDPAALVAGTRSPVRSPDLPAAFRDKGVYISALCFCQLSQITQS